MPRMNRALQLALVFFAIAGCTLPPEKVPVKPLPDDLQAMPYGDLLTRARMQATSATEAFYINNWADLEESAKGLEQTALFLGKASDVPAKQKDVLAVVAGDLGKEAAHLREVSQRKDAKQANEVLQQITLKVRELRLEN